MEYLLHIIVLVCIYTTLAASLDLLAGHTGLLSIAHAAFFGIGAYASALLATGMGAPFLVEVLLSVLIAILFSFIISIPSLRLQGDYFILATFSFQVIFLGVILNWNSLTRGPLGISGIPRPVIFGWGVNTLFEFVVITTIVASLSYLLIILLTSSPFGRVLRGIRQDEVFTQALGKDILRFKVIVFAVSAGVAALSGVLYAHYITFIDPSSFTVLESILIISMVIVGGAGSPWGPLIGAIILVTVPELLRFLGLPIHISANLRQIIYGVLLLLMITMRPNGLVGKYRFDR